MTTVKQLSQELLKFPTDAIVTLFKQRMYIAPPRRRVFRMAEIHCPDTGRSEATVEGDFEGRLDKEYKTPAEKIIRHLYENPEAARQIAYAAVASIYLEGGNVLAEEDECPISGSDFIQNIGNAIEWSGVEDLIKELRQENSENG